MTRRTKMMIHPSSESPSEESSSNTNITHFSKSKRTQYTIDEPGLDSEILQKSIQKHCDTLSVYLSEKPVASHAQEAFSILQEQFVGMGDGNNKQIILDSGCGTGRSTLLLGSMYPDHVVVGVDRSLARLSKSGVQLQQFTTTNNHQNKPQSNVILVRAELADFWRLWINSSPLSSSLVIDKHYLLYPNPYPKRKRYSNRWYAHPAFPLIPKLGSNEIVLRSNWKEYLKDFSIAISLVEKYWQNDEDMAQYESSPIVEVNPTNGVAWTNFEQKYFNVGETTYELVLKKKQQGENKKIINPG